ncbi:MAG: hypothetical protein U9R23_06595 [Candidatus Cloacimonadota bacterium]|nr:hypothetical protein [Candidatus Cloacimonadota bacterium]
MRKKSKKILLFFTLIIVFSFKLYATPIENQILLYGLHGVNARALGLGDAYVSLADASSIYWNPGALGKLSKPELFLSHSNIQKYQYKFYDSDINNEFLSLVLSSKYGDFGFCSNYMNNTFDFVDEFFGYGKWNEAVKKIGIAYSKEIIKPLSLGATYNYFEYSCYSEQLYSHSFNFGALFNFYEKFTVGFAYRNIAPDLQFKIDNDNDGLINEDLYDEIDNDGDGLIDEDCEELPFPLLKNFSLGFSTFLLKNTNYDLLLTYQFDKVEKDSKNSINNSKVGIEYRFNDIFLRLGYQSNYYSDRISWGVGYQFDISNLTTKIDFAYSHNTESYSSIGDQFVVSTIIQF